MFQFILTNLLMIALGTIVFLVVRALPRIEEDGMPEKKSWIERWVTSEAPERLDRAMNAFLGKTLRKLKVFMLRLDNFLAGQLKKIRVEENGNGKQKIDFKEITGEKNRTNGEQV